MINFTRRIHLAFLAFSFASIPVAYVISTQFGAFPLKALLALGGLSSGLFFINTFARTDATLTRHFIINFSVFILFCLLLMRGFLHAPHVSDVQDAGRKFDATIYFLYLFTLALFFLSCRREAERNLALTSILVGMSLVPVTMFVYDVFAGSAGVYFEMWRSGVRVQATGLVLSPNVNAIYGAIGVMSTALLIASKRWYLFFPALLCGFFYVLISQSQGVIISLVGSLLLMVFPGKFVSNLLVVVLIYWIFSAPLQVALYASLDGTWLGDLLTRQEASGLGVGTGRVYIWTAALEEVFRGFDRFVLGSGSNSAASTTVLSAFYVAINPSDIFDLYTRSYSLHNAALQFLFDFGFIALLAISRMTYVAIYQLKVGNQIVLPLIAFLLTSGLNEAVASPSLPLVFVFFIAILSFGVLGVSPVAAERAAR